ncbi:MAG: hypothetical protein WKF79_00480 [Nocardioides sp.]
MKITKIDKAALINLRAPLEAELAALGERLGLKFEIGSGSYDPSGAEASFKLKMRVDDPALREAAARARWNGSCQWIGHKFDAPDGTTGLRPEDFGTEFTSGGTTYHTTGLNPGRSKFCIAVDVMTGPKKGKAVAFDERAVPIIRRATDAKAAGLPGFSAFADAKTAAAG